MVGIDLGMLQNLILMGLVIGGRSYLVLNLLAEDGGCRKWMPDWV